MNRIFSSVDLSSYMFIEYIWHVFIDFPYMPINILYKRYFRPEMFVIHITLMLSL